MPAHPAGRAAAWGAAVALCVAAGQGVRAESGIARLDFSGRVAVESRWFPDEGLDPAQESHAAGLVLHPTLYVEGSGGGSVTVSPFLRYDGADPRRSHADLREAYLLFFGGAGSGEWELRAGVDHVFWGVADVRHLVDIVNQIDLVEHPNEESKLGQPMLHLTWTDEWGALEVFGMTYHRPRTFPGRSGRLRSPTVVDDESVSYESDAEEWNLDVAARYSHTVGPLNFGLSVFDGTSRDPTLRPPAAPTADPLLTQHYERIRQYGLDAQLTLSEWQLYLEAIRRTGLSNRAGLDEDYDAFVFGGNYSFWSVWDTPGDLNVLAEWFHDARGETGTNVFQNDLFSAVRYSFNDVEGTEITAGILTDLDYGTTSLTLEFSRRLTDNWTLRWETFWFMDVDPEDVLSAGLERDSFMETSLSYNF